MTPDGTPTLTSSRIAVLISDFADRRQVVEVLAPFSDVRVCQSSLVLRSMLVNRDLTGVVCACRDVDVASSVFARPVEQADLDVPTLIFVRPCAADVLSFTCLVQSGWPLLGRVAGQVSLDHAVRSIIKNEWRPEASATIVRRTAERYGSSLEPMVVLAMIAGSRKLSVTAFAHLARVSERTLERRLAIAGLPPAVRLLGWATTLHAVWRLEMDGAGVKEATAAGGFATRGGFANFIRRHANGPPGQLYRQGSFIRTLEAFFEDLQGNVLHGHGFVRAARPASALAR